MGNKNRSLCELLSEKCDENGLIDGKELVRWVGVDGYLYCRFHGLAVPYDESEDGTPVFKISR